METIIAAAVSGAAGIICSVLAAVSSNAKHAAELESRLDKWQAVLELIAENDPMLNSYLRGTQAYYDGRRVLIECSDDFRDFMRRSKETSKNIKQYIYQVTHIKCGIGPYEKTAAAVSNAPAADVEETLRQMKDLGVDVVVEDK